MALIRGVARGILSVSGNYRRLPLYKYSYIHCTNSLYTSMQEGQKDYHEPSAKWLAMESSSNFKQQAMECEPLAILYSQFIYNFLEI